MVRWNWPLICFFAAISAILVVGIFLPPEDRICSAVLQAEVAKQANTPVFGCLEFWLNRYQTLLSALLALGAAGASIYFLRRQISQADRQEEERYAREGAAARAVLPVTLSALCEYAVEAGSSLAHILPTLAVAGVVKGLSKQFPELPEGPIGQLEKVIKTIPVDQGKAFAEIIAEMQVLNARARSMIEEGRAVKHNVLEYILDAVEIYARCSANFDYARRYSEATQSTIPRQDMKSACNVMRLFRVREELYIMIDRKEKRYPAG